MKKHKQVSSEMLPSRHAMAQVSKGDVYQRSLQNYAKKTPGMTTSTPNIMFMGRGR